MSRHLSLLDSEDPSESFPHLTRIRETFRPALPGLNRFIQTFLRTAPQRKPNLPSRDAERFVKWLYDNVEVTREQEDLLVSLRLRQTAEYSALQRQLAAVRFQMLAEKRVPANLRGADIHQLRIEFNPLHLFTTIQRKPGEAITTVLLFQGQRDVRTMAIQAEAELWVRMLAEQDLTVGEFLSRCEADHRPELIELLEELLRLQVVALAPAV